MKQNRTEVRSAVSADLVSVITAPILRTNLNDAFANSIEFKKDVSGTQDATGLSSLVIDFSVNDTVSITNISQNFSISVTGNADGERNFIEVNKQTTNTVSFSGGILDQTVGKNFVNESMTKVVYEIIYKSGVVYANALTQNLIKANTSDTLTSSSPSNNRYVTPLTLQTSAYWTTPTLTDTRISQNPSFPVRYKKDSLGGVWISGVVVVDTATLISNIDLFTLPASHQVSALSFFAPCYTNNAVPTRVRYDNAPLGEVTIAPLGVGSIAAGDSIYIHFYIPRDA